MIDPGALKTCLTIEAPVETDDGQGGVARDYAPFAKVWAKVAPLGARHDVAADADGVAVRYRILSFQERDNGRFIEIETELRVE